MKEHKILIYRCRTGLSEEKAKQVEHIERHIRERPNTFLQMETFLPKKNG